MRLRAQAIAGRCPKSFGGGSAPVWRRGTAANQRVDHQDAHPKSKSGSGHIQAIADEVRLWMLRHGPHGQPDDNREEACHQQDGAHDRQGDDCPHPSRGACIGAH
jgi:hypothetical protein